MMSRVLAARRSPRVATAGERLATPNGWLTPAHHWLSLPPPTEPQPSSIELGLRRVSRRASASETLPAAVVVRAASAVSALLIARSLARSSWAPSDWAWSASAGS